MSNFLDAFVANHKEQSKIEKGKIEIITSEVQAGEYYIAASDGHGIGIAPSFHTTTPVSYDGCAYKDIKWNPHTIGYLPPGMKQEGALLQPAKATNIFIDKNFLLASTPPGMNVSSVDFREITGHMDPVFSHLMLTLGYIAEKESTDDWEVLIESIGTSLCIRLMHVLGANFKKIDFRSGRIDRAVEYINDNLDKKMSLDELAGSASLSRFHFSRQFKSACGISPQNYIIKQRAEKATRMIKFSPTAFDAIALTCGFSSQSHMNRMVKRHTGMTPGQIRLNR